MLQERESSGRRFFGGALRSGAPKWSFVTAIKSWVAHRRFGGSTPVSRECECEGLGLVNGEGATESREGCSIVGRIASLVKGGGDGTPKQRK